MGCLHRASHRLARSVPARRQPNGIASDARATFGHRTGSCDSAGAAQYLAFRKCPSLLSCQRDSRTRFPEECPMTRSIDCRHAHPAARGCAAGCGSYPPPTERLTTAEAAIRGAQEVNAANSRRAALHLKLAQEQTDKAKRLMEDGYNETRRAHAQARAGRRRTGDRDHRRNRDVAQAKRRRPGSSRPRRDAAARNAVKARRSSETDATMTWTRMTTGRCLLFVRARRLRHARNVRRSSCSTHAPRTTRSAPAKPRSTRRPICTRRRSR